MKRIFMVELSNRFSSSLARWPFEVVATDAKKAIDRAIRQAKREEWRQSGWQVERVLHRGAAV